MSTFVYAGGFMWRLLTLTFWYRGGVLFFLEIGRGDFFFELGVFFSTFTFMLEYLLC